MGSRGSSEQSIPSWALPYAQRLLQTGANTVAPGYQKPEEVFNLAQIDPNMFQKVQSFTPEQQEGMQYLTGSALDQSKALAGTGAGEISNTVQGQYLNPATNPYLQQTYDAATRAMTNQYSQAIAPSNMAAAQQAGVGGGSAENENRQYQQFQLGQNLSDLASQIYGGNFQNERARQLQAATMIPGAQAALAAPGEQQLKVGTLRQGQGQAELDAAQQNAALATEYPYKILSYLGNLIGTATGAGGQVTANTSK